MADLHEQMRWPEPWTVMDRSTNELPLYHLNFHWQANLTRLLFAGIACMAHGPYRFGQPYLSARASVEPCLNSLKVI